jgi:hypothetical protein
MKASELRIGNKFYLPNGEVGTISYHEIRLLVVSQEKPNYKPIPLTEEWLLKFGWKFEKDFRKDFWFCIDNEGNRSEFGVISTLTIGKYNYADYFTLYGIRVDYVHQLQNLYFALTGEELVVKE